MLIIDLERAFAGRRNAEGRSLTELWMKNAHSFCFAGRAVRG